MFAYLIRTRSEFFASGIDPKSKFGCMPHSPSALPFAKPLALFAFALFVLFLRAASANVIILSFVSFGRLDQL
jgi:hypothetical protein